MSDYSDLPELDFDDYLRRAIAICVEAVGGEGEPSWFYTSENTPYFMARVANLVWTDDGQDVDQWDFDIIVRHIVENRTARIPGEVETAFYRDMQIVAATLLRRDLLQSGEGDYAEPPDWLESALLTSSLGLAVFAGPVDGVTGGQTGTEYTIHCIARTTKYLDYE